MSETLAPSKCPVCGQPNQCGLSDPATATQPCWCFDAEIAPGTRAQIPDVALHKACICQRCARGELPAEL
ncbi:cysteine-rich CWC family protein [Pseudomonas sp. SST3]|uniref:cysteine-rich CWC family protein n=1 Tax=Pseudomonas sp. SST3 TaxID=2267882 RepID=UPI000DFAC5F4|nr:cysteine-rich CWC family protein [Pseudomonas sp. SST3]NKQ09965.1 cysteine-rich CWC family protein [Pseudomonas sp. SST3]